MSLFPEAARQPPAPLCLTPLQLEDLVALKLRDVCAGIADWKLPLTVVGTLGDLPTARYSGRIYKLPLLDAAAPGAITYLNIRETALQQAHVEPGDMVRVTGAIVPEIFKGTMSFRLEVVSIGHEAPAAAPRLRETTSSLDLLRRLALERQPFPALAQPTVTLIQPAASQALVAEDFAGALTPEQAAALNRVAVSMHDPVAIAAALRQVRTDVVVVIRGGGDAAGFAVFEDPAVLEALASCRAYRLLGLGHTANRTLAELVADHAASTPTAAGEHLRRRIAEASRLVGRNGQLQELRETLANRDMELAREQQAARLLAEKQPAVVEQVDLAPAGRPMIPAWLWVAAGAVATWLVLRML